MNEVISLASSIASLILAILAIVLSIGFFVLSTKTERRSAESLTKISTQADSLQRIHARWMDRLTRYATEDRPSPNDSLVSSLTVLLSQLPQSLTAALRPNDTNQTNEQLIEEIHTLYIALYFYSAQANFWSQFYIPTPEEFDESNGLHTLPVRITDMSAADFQCMADILGICDAGRLSKSKIKHLLDETIDLWREKVRTSSQVMAAKAKEQNS